MNWWIWTILGFVLLFLELLTPSGFALFILGIAALVMGIVLVAGLSVPLWIQLVLYSFVALLLLALLPKRLRRRLESPLSTYEVEEVIAVERIEPGATGKAEARGTVWQVTNSGDAPVLSGTRCRVIGRAGITLQVKGE